MENVKEKSKLLLFLPVLML